MQQENYKVTRREKIFFNFLEIENEMHVEDIVSYLSSTLQEVIKQYSIPQINIENIHLNKFEKDGEEKIVITIKYCTLNLAELKKLEPVEQIRMVLNVMRYKDEDIKSIVYRKYWSNSDEKVWVAEVYDPDYDFDLDETYSERSFRSGVMNPIREVLGYSVMVDFI